MNWDAILLITIIGGAFTTCAVTGYQESQETLAAREHCRETHAADYAALQAGMTDPHWSGAITRRLECAKGER